MTQDRSWCRFYHISEVGELENEEITYVELARDLESNCDVTIFVTCFISSDKCDTDTILVSVFTIFEAEELENNDIIHVELMRELDSD